MLHISEFDNPIVGVDAMTSRFMERMISMIFKEDGNDIKAYRFLLLHSKDSIRKRNERYNAWLNYLAKKASTAPPIPIREYRSKAFAKEKLLLMLLDQLRKDEFPATLRAKVMSLLIDSWKKGERSSRNVFEQLGLHVKPTSGHSVNVDLLELWIHFVHERYSEPTRKMYKMIYSLNNDVRVMLLDSLRQIKGVEGDVVKFTENLLLSIWIDRKVPVEQVFDMLNLKNVKDNEDIIVWVKYVVKVIDTLQPEEKEVVMQLVNGYGIEGLIKMLVALTLNDVGKDLQPLLLSTVAEIWKADHKTWKDVLPILEGNRDIFGDSSTYEQFWELKKNVGKEIPPPDLW